MNIFVLALGEEPAPAISDVTFSSCNYTSLGGNRLAEFLNVFENASPDFFFFAKSVQLTPSVLAEIKKRSPKTKFVMSYFDQRGTVPDIILERKKFLHALLVNNEDQEQFKMYRRAGIPNVYTFHHYVYPTWFQSMPNIPVKYNIFFGGSHFGIDKFPLSEFRYKFVTYLKRKFPGTVVYGRGWPFRAHTRVYKRDYINAMREAHINLGINHFDVVRYYDRRLFESMASGRLHITKYIPGMEKTFGKNGDHLVWFKTPQEGTRVFSYYLRHPELREQIAERGKKLVLSSHTFSVRIQQLVNIFSKL